MLPIKLRFKSVFRQGREYLEPRGYKSEDASHLTCRDHAEVAVEKAKKAAAPDDTYSQKLVQKQFTTNNNLKI